MINSPYQAKYIAHKLRSYANNDVAKLAGVFFDAQIDPNPHQIDAALFALTKPFLKGSILADEVGLGKTIEAGIVIAQYWAEQKRKILIVAPSSLRQQWQQELVDRFNLSSMIVDAKADREYRAKHKHSPFEKPGVYICSYDYAHRHNDELNRGWDLMICDEAHKLRNYYKNTSKSTVAKSIAHLAKFTDKVLFLTATPLQNNLAELYGLVSILEPNYFHSLEVFRERYMKGDNPYARQDLRERIAKITKRTLRTQTNVQYTERKPVTIRFKSSPEEQKLYDLIDAYLNRENLYAFAKSQRHLVSLIIRKRLGSSTYAVASTLENIVLRMQAELAQGYKRDNRGGLIGIGDDIDLTDDEAEEYGEYTTYAREHDLVAKTRDEEQAFQDEINELEQYTRIAYEITSNAKAEHLIESINIGFEKLKPGAARKAIVFTESTKTQEYLTKVLDADGHYTYVTFNGQNNDQKSNKIYREWREKNTENDLVTGVETVDRRKAIIDAFRDEDVQIMIATEAAAEGINLQFCSMLINYDLPWNPQRVEQRIGRVHRYGQKYDVVVVNFNNEGNVAEQRILELLDTKFNLFSGVFGASNEVLGTIEDGLDFEKQISDILSRCRTSEEIKLGFDDLLARNKEEIDKSQAKARAKVLDNLDPDVQDKFNQYGKRQSESFNKFEQMLIDLTKYELGESAEFSHDDHVFTLSHPYAGAELGKYFFKLDTDKRPLDARQFRYSGAIAEKAIDDAANAKTPSAQLTFSLSQTERPSTVVKQLAGKSGVLMTKLVSYGDESRGLGEQYIMAVAQTDDGELLDEETSAKLLDLTCVDHRESVFLMSDDVEAVMRERIDDKQAEVRDRNASYYFDEKDRVQNGMKDRVTELDMKARKVEAQIDELEKKSRKTVIGNDRLKIESEIQKLKGRRKDLRREQFEIEDGADEQLEQSLGKVQKILDEAPRSEGLFTVIWSVEG